MSKKGSRKIGNCAYCGKRKELSQDHVIPLCLFPKVKAKDEEMITVYACDNCNNVKKSKNDAFLRDILVGDIWNENNPLAQEPHQAMLRAVQKNRSPLAKQIIDNAYPETYISKDGRVRVNGYMLPFEEELKEQFQNTFETIARGLYFKNSGEIYPKNYTFDIMRIEPIEYLEVIHELEQYGVNSCRRFSDGVFSWRGVYASDDHAQYVQLLSFYDRVMFLIISNAPN